MNRSETKKPMTFYCGCEQRLTPTTEMETKHPRWIGKVRSSPDQETLVTLAACGPFCPSTISNSTLSPSCKLL